MVTKKWLKKYDPKKNKNEFHLRHGGTDQIDDRRHAGGAHHGAQDTAQQIAGAQAPQVRDPILWSKWDKFLFV